MTPKWKRIAPGYYGFALLEEDCTVEIHCMVFQKHGKWQWAATALFPVEGLTANVSVGEYVATKAAAQACAVEAIPTVRGMMATLRGRPATGGQ